MLAKTWHPPHPCLLRPYACCHPYMSGIYLSQQERSVQYTRLTWLTRVTRLNTRGGNWLQSQRPSARVYGDYSLIIAINSSFSVNNRTRSAAECHLYWLPPRCAPPQPRVPSRVWSRQIGGAGLDGLRLPCPGGCFVIVFAIF